MANYIDADAMRAYITDTDLRKYAPLQAESDPVLSGYLEGWNLTIDDGEIYLDSFIQSRKITQITYFSEVSLSVRRMLGAYLSYKLCFDRIANNPQQNLTDLQYDLYKNKLAELKARWESLESGLSYEDITGEEDPNQTSGNVIELFRR